MSDTTKLWNEALYLDPAFTKTFNRPGGFSGRGTNATYLVRRATETFGPCGIGWGWDVLADRYEDGHDILTSDGAVIGRVKTHVVRIKLWYIYHEKRGEIEHFGQTTYVGKDNRGIFTDEEHAKKSLTDAIVKALSCIGFAAEIYQGLWDDSKYFAEIQQRDYASNGGTARSSGSAVTPQPPLPPQVGMPQKLIDKLVAEFAKLTDTAELRNKVSVAFSMAQNEYADPAAHKTLKDAANKRLAELVAAKKQQVQS